MVYIYNNLYPPNVNVFMTTTQVILSLKRALQPAVTEVSVVFQVPKEYEVVQCPASLPPISNGEKLVSYAMLKSKKAPKKAVSCTAILEGNMLGKKQEHKIPFTIDGSVPAPSLPVIHHLAAKTLITGWEIEGKEKKSIVDLSIESSVISSHTAFIAIDEESSEPVSGALKTYDVQTQMPTFGRVALRGALGSASKPSYRAVMSVPRARRAKGGGGGGGDVQASMSMYDVQASMMYGNAIMGGGNCAKLDGGHFQFGGVVSAKNKRSRRKSKMAGAPPPMFCSPQSYSATPALASASTYDCYGGFDMCVVSPPHAMASGSPESKPTNTLTSLITAQQVDGSWALTSSFAQLVGKSLSDLETVCPIERKGAGATVWATVLAVSLLRARYSSQQEEWELIAMKAESWLKKQTLPPGCTLEQLFQAAQKQF